MTIEPAYARILSKHCPQGTAADREASLVKKQALIIIELEREVMRMMEANRRLQAQVGERAVTREGL